MESRRPHSLPQYQPLLISATPIARGLKARSLRRFVGAWRNWFMKRGGHATPILEAWRKREDTPLALAHRATIAAHHYTRNQRSHLILVRGIARSAYRLPPRHGAKEPQGRIAAYNWPCGKLII